MNHWHPEVVYPNQFAYTTILGIISELRLSSHFLGDKRTSSFPISADVNELS